MFQQYSWFLKWLNFLMRKNNTNHAFEELTILTFSSSKLHQRAYMNVFVSLIHFQVVMFKLTRNCLNVQSAFSPWILHRQSGWGTKSWWGHSSRIELPIAMGFQTELQHEAHL